MLDAGSQLQVAALGMLNRQRVSASSFLSPYAMDAPALGMMTRSIRKTTVGLFAGLDLDFIGVCIAQRLLPPLARIMPRWRNRSGRLSLTTGVAQLYYYSMQASYQMLDLLEQTRDVIDYAVAHQSKVAHGLEASAFPRRAGTDSGGR